MCQGDPHARPMEKGCTEGGGGWRGRRKKNRGAWHNGTLKIRKNSVTHKQKGKTKAFKTKKPGRAVKDGLGTESTRVEGDGKKSTGKEADTTPPRKERPLPKNGKDV